jgi:hypothetical protein
MISAGKLRLGIHSTKPNGGRPVFIWAAVQAWVESGSR